MRGFLLETSFRKFLLVLIFSIAISLIASIPYIYGFLRESKAPDVYLGRSIVNSADTYIFLSHIESVKQGEILLPNLYTSDLRDGFFIKPIYIGIGLIARIFNLNSLLAFHVSRFILSVLFLLTIWVFLGYIFKKFRRKFLALVLVSTSTGIGYLVKDWLPSSIDLWVPEANTFFSITEAPHFIWSQIGILVLVITLLKFRVTGKVTFLVTGSIFSSLVVLEHPYLIPFLILLPPLFLIVCSKNIKAYVANCIAVVAIPFLVAIFLYITFQNSPGLTQYSKQAVLITPPIINILTGYGLLIPLAIYGIIKGKTGDTRRYLLILWVSLLIFLIYMPFPFQRRLLESLHLPIAISGALALGSWRLKSYISKILLIGLLVIVGIGNIYLVGYSIKVIAADTSDSYSHHIYKEDLEGLLWIRDKSTPDELILANFYYSNIIPGITGRYVYNGHFYNTVNSKNKLVEYDNFIKGDRETRNAFVKINKPRFIFLGKVDPYNSYRNSLIEEGYIPVWERNGVFVLEVI